MALFLPATDQTLRRDQRRYPFAVHVVIERRVRLFAQPERIDGALIDLSEDGAGIVVPSSVDFRERATHRIFVNDHEGVIQVRNITLIDDDRQRLGVRFRRLGLDLQELVADSLDAAHRAESRLS